MNESWIKDLASNSNARFRQQENQQLQREKLVKAYEYILGELSDEFNLAVNIFNEHSKEKVKLLNVNPSANPYPDAIIMLLSGTQVKIQKGNNCLEVIASMVQDFRQINRKIHTFVPHSNNFGSVNWLMDNKVLMSIDMMVKQIFGDLCMISSQIKNRR